MRVYEIVPGLYQSLTPLERDDREFNDQDGKRVDITAVLDLEGTIDPNIPLEELGDVYVYWPIEDKPKMVDQDTVRATARYISGLMDAGHRVLIHCHSGLNRASLLSGRTLIHRGMEPKEAVELIRERRSPDVLSNEVFERWLLEEEPGT
ncbi:MAG TPA: dual specificity protein phosphatase [Actinomycetota bacterium]|nr:dual specificity protein phosphatase [Actinomycetota bacterium]